MPALLEVGQYCAAIGAIVGVVVLVVKLAQWFKERFPKKAELTTVFPIDGPHYLMNESETDEAVRNHFRERLKTD